MKIALLTPTFSKFSGPDRVVLNEATGLAGKGNSVTVLTFRTDFDLLQLQKKGISVEVLGMPKSPFFERLYRLLFFLDLPKINSVAKKLRQFDQAISFLYPMTLPATIARRKSKQLKYTYYDVGVAYPQLFERFTERAYMGLFAILTRMTTRNADAAISISKFLSNELRKQTGLRSTVKYVAIDKKRFNSKVLATSKKEIAAIIRKHGLRRPTLLYVGRISPHKGVHLLLEAFAIVRKRFPEATLVIVGKHTFADYSLRLHERAAAIGGVVFAGYVPDEELPGYYGASDVYATASRWEGFNIPIVEANAVGKPVVAFRIGSHQEVLKKGTLVEDGDVAGFAAAVVKILHYRKV